MKTFIWIVSALVVAGYISELFGGEQVTMSSMIEVYDSTAGGLVSTNRVVLSVEEWKNKLTPESFKIMRQHGTERPFSCGRLTDKGEGTYTCAGCGLELFVSTSKFDSGTGWPSFFQPIHPNNIGTTTDFKIGYPRTEVHCARCGGHLGHVFEDGPKPTGLRYCMNGASLNFTPAASPEK
jgi:peptide-methionine (R)-S-oxide reductase